MKDYFGWREDIDRPPELDWKLMRPTRLSLIHDSLIKPEASPMATQQDRQATS